MIGVSRDTLYRYRSAKDEGGVEALLEKTKRVLNPKNRVEPQTEQAVLEFAQEYPDHGQVRVSNELRKQVYSSHRAAFEASGSTYATEP